MHDEQIIQHTQPYPNVNKVLKELYIDNIPMAIATNKRSAPTQKLIDYFGWNDYFLFIECCDSQSNLKKKNVMIKDIIKENKIFTGLMLKPIKK